MSLASFAFLVAFLPVVAIVAHLLRDRFSPRTAQAWILLASLAFYSRSGWRYLLLLLASAAFNWAVARSFRSPRFGPAGRSRMLKLGLTVDILVLCVVKYAKFLLGPVVHSIGRDLALPTWAFPLGVSFYTLTQVMYLVDCYENLVPPNSAFDHATFVSFFPNVSLGPLVRAKLFVGQLGNLASPENRDDRLARAIALMAIGLFKKVVIADSFARVADAGYGHVGTLTTVGAWVTSLAYTFQLYFDFSGYSDLAFGAGRLLGVTLVRNFNAPYRAATVIEFWQRWHISLSNFITTYLYTPIIRGMGRVTINKAAVATLLAMTIAGLWHGPAWTFVLFGLLHGVGLATNQYWKRVKRPLPRPIAVVATFVFVNVTLIVFRSPSVATALQVAWRLVPVQRVMGLHDLVTTIPSAVMRIIALPIAFGCIVAFAGPTSDEIAATFRPSRLAGVAIFAMIVVSFMYMITGTGSDFIYRVF
jgi:alginate O-acetyltransferase complex protein AlgI